MQLDRRINGTTILTGLIGNPVGHSVSPVLHNSLYTVLGINGAYVPLPVPGGSLGEAVKGLKACGFAGFNITIPYKEEILEYIDEADEEVKLLGTSNTVCIRNGRLYAYNTDADGFVRDFKEQAGTGFERKNVCILGAGGTARALSAKIILDGAAEVNIINRTGSKAETLAGVLNRLLKERGCAAKRVSAAASYTTEALKLLSRCDVIVNTTSAGMHPVTDASPLPQDFTFKSSQFIYDVIYNPSRTKLISTAKEYGCQTANGAGMLFYQGIRAFEIFTGTTVPDETAKWLLADFLKYL